MLGCTSTTDAVTNTNTGSSDTAAPIYWLNGAKVADNYADLYDGSWDSNAPKYPSGANAPTTGAGSRTFTGCNDFGNKSANPLGSTNVTQGFPAAASNELGGSVTFNTNTRRYYGLSEIFTAAEAQTPATVVAVSRVSVDGTYNLGETISMTIVFNVAVTVTGTPQLALEIGTKTPRANYASGSGTVTLQFDYEVVAGDEDTDGINVPTNALTLNGGTISASGTPANVSHASNLFLGILVDGGPAVVVPAPTVTGVALTSAPGSDNTYAIGDAVTATVTFDAAVDITGSPQLELDFDGTAKAAACATGTNTTTMACSYTVAVGDAAPNGVAIGANKLTGGTIYATGSTTVSADLDHVAVAIDAGHKVDGIRPTLVTTGDDAPTTSTDGTQVILTFSENLGFVDALGIETGGPGAIQSASFSGRTVTVTLYSSLTIAAGDTVTVRLIINAVKDAAGNGNLALAQTTTVINAVPAPTVTGVALTEVPNNNTWAIGDEIEATVTFSAAVDITGAPELELDFAGTPKPAACTADTNTTTMACYYTVVVNDTAPNGIAIAANKLTLNGGTITATGSTTVNAVLAHGAVAIDAGQKVDGIRPTLVTTGNEAPTTSTDGTQVILTFSEDIGAADRTKITIGIGGGNVAVTSAARVAGTTVELDLSTVIDATVMLTVALDAVAVEDGAGNGNLAVPATPVINAIGSTTAPTVTAVELTFDPGTDNTYAVSNSGQGGR